MSIKLIVGLGNPGPKYERTRHNAGWWWIDLIAQQHKVTWQFSSKYNAEICKIELAGEDCWLMKPQTFMNLSGQSVSGLANFYKIPMDAVLAAHDELDIPCGTAKMKRGGGTGGHNGLNSMVECSGTQDFWRLRLGIGHPGHKDLVSAYVLKAASLNEQALLDKMVDRALGIMPYINRGKILDGVTWLHSTPKEPKAPKVPKEPKESKEPPSETK
jgi:peptidyl-tRNA hydrolase, PTH1 family